jgi:hypothetical protein
MRKLVAVGAVLAGAVGSLSVVSNASAYADTTNGHCQNLTGGYFGPEVRFMKSLIVHGIDCTSVYYEILSYMVSYDGGNFVANSPSAARVRFVVPAFTGEGGVRYRRYTWTCSIKRYKVEPMPLPISCKSGRVAVSFTWHNWGAGVGHGCPSLSLPVRSDPYTNPAVTPTIRVSGIEVSASYVCQTDPSRLDGAEGMVLAAYRAWLQPWPDNQRATYTYKDSLAHTRWVCQIADLYVGSDTLADIFQWQWNCVSRSRLDPYGVEVSFGIARHEQVEVQCYLSTGRCISDQGVDPAPQPISGSVDPQLVCAWQDDGSGTDAFGTYEQYICR